MTQVKDMTDQQLDEWLAVNCMGWREDEHPEVHGTGQWMAEYEFPVYYKPDGSFILSGDWTPCTDPAASLEVEAKAIEVDAEKYMRNLAIVRWKLDVLSDWTYFTLDKAADLHISSPRERAEAAYITLQGAT